MKGGRKFGLLPVPSFAQLPNEASRLLFVAGMLVFGLCGRVASADSNDLRSRLEALAAESGFAIGGLEWIGREAAGDERGSASDRLNSLLRDYNYGLIEDGRGGIKKVFITSRKTSEAKSWPDSATVYTVRVGSRHEVEAAIAGPNGIVRIVRLIVDTGATTVVLPASMIPELGFAQEDMQPRISWTANGPVPSLVGMLRSVKLGPVSADNVRVSFDDDQRLHGSMLLGMSFLQRFRMTLDDDRNELVLQTK